MCVYRACCCLKIEMCILGISSQQVDRISAAEPSEWPNLHSPASSVLWGDCKAANGGDKFCLAFEKVLSLTFHISESDSRSLVNARYYKQSMLL
uniref:Uncharacterized protein n=1 Tax=Rhinopithecus roxellana TaxID=61622 RepID=A0A2K6PQT8_RHIRO